MCIQTICDHWSYVPPALEAIWVLCKTIYEDNILNIYTDLRYASVSADTRAQNSRDLMRWTSRLLVCDSYCRGLPIYCHEFFLKNLIEIKKNSWHEM